MVETEHNSITTVRKVYRAVVIGLGMLPIICMTLIAGSMLLLMLYVFASFVVVAIS